MNEQKQIKRCVATTEREEVLCGWLCHWQCAYPDILIIECSCSHVSVRDRDEVSEHVCPGCGTDKPKY